MATIGAKAEMDKAATARLEAATGVLSERFGLVRPEPRHAANDNHLAAIYGREDMATLLEGLVAATTPQTHVETRPRIAPDVQTVGSDTPVFFETHSLWVATDPSTDEPAEEDDMGKPSKGTPKDKRLSRNKPK